MVERSPAQQAWEDSSVTVLPFELLSDAGKTELTDLVTQGKATPRALETLYRKERPKMELTYRQKLDEAKSHLGGEYGDGAKDIKEAHSTVMTLAFFGTDSNINKGDVRKDALKVVFSNRYDENVRIKMNDAFVEKAAERKYLEGKNKKGETNPWLVYAEEHGLLKEVYFCHPAAKNAARVDGIAETDKSNLH